MYLDLPDCRVYYEVSGDGPIVVHIHGFFLDLNHLKRPMERAFSEVPGFKRIYFDLPGMGRTITRRQLMTAEEMFAVVTQVIDALTDGKPYAVVGGSYGAYLGRGLVRLQSKRVTGAMWVCPVIFANHARRTVPLRIILEESPTIKEQLSPEEYVGFTEIAVIANDQTWALHKLDILPGLTRANEAFLTTYAESGYAFKTEASGHIESFDGPTLILCGRQDNVVGYEDAYRLLSTYPRASFVVLDRVGHNVPVEAPDLFHQHVSEWLRRL